MSSTLDQAVTSLRGVGPKIAERLKKLHISSVRDLIFHLPSRYEDRTHVTPIGVLRPPVEALVEGVIESAQVTFGRRRTLVCRLVDGTGELTLRFFYFNRAQQNRLAPGQHLRCYGETRHGPSGYEFVHPECEYIDPENPPPINNTLTPIYPKTEGLRQLSLRKITQQALELLSSTNDNEAILDDYLDTETLQQLQLPPLSTALQFVHQPDPSADVEALLAGTHPAQRRLAFEELLAHQLSLRLLRQTTQKYGAQVFCGKSMLRAKLLKQFGFNLTGAQRRVIHEIDQDLAKAMPMLRLLQGDVGAGKTAVAAMLAVRVLEQQSQVALMAPTELLAQQHKHNLSIWFEPLGIDVVALTGRLGKRERREILEQIESQAAILIVGTHALFQDEVQYRSLGLIIIDEQHRFGVDQRLALSEKGASENARPHQLIMTATPIPRTLAMTAYADLDVSVIDELPPGRKPVRTAVLPNDRRAEVIERIAHRCADGHQAYWVCPLIDESEVLEVQAASDTAEILREALPDLRIGLIHGRLSDKEKESTMADFIARRIALLVATTVIEVGVDVPNANLMIIENAERLGLSQLHQLRGRVGRGGEIADCLLLYKAPLSETAKARLKVIRETNDGFIIAERDLALRGAGELLGTRQAGASEFRIADLVRDAAIIPAVQHSAMRLLNGNKSIVTVLIRRWMGDRIEYSNV